MQKIKELFQQFIGFGLIGGINTVLAYLIYFICVKVLGWYPVAGNTIGWVITVFISYLLNSRFVFKGVEHETIKDKFRSLLKVYMSYAFSGLILNNVLLLIEINILGVPELLAPIINLVVTIPINFILNKFWAYGKKKETKKDD